MLALCMFLSMVSTVWAADVTLKWATVDDADGYRISQSVDMGNTWGTPIDVGDVSSYTVTGVPDSGLVMWRVESYNAHGTAINSWAGAWYNKDWQPPTAPTQLGVQ